MRAATSSLPHQHRCNHAHRLRHGGVLRLRQSRPCTGVAHAAAAPGAAARLVTAEEIFQAAMINMPTADDKTMVGFGGRWERWQPPAANAAAVAHHNAGSSLVSKSGWQLISSGQSVYAFQATGAGAETSNSQPTLTVHVMEAPDSTPTTIEDALKLAGSSSSSSSAAQQSTAQRSTNTFTVHDVFFDPRLPNEASAAAAGPAAGLRLWAANHHGFAMAPVTLPRELLAGSDSTSASNSAAQQMPFIANLYVKHPSLAPGTGCRWGWNLQFEPSGRGSMSHVHHTSLQLLALADLEADLAPGRHQPPAPTWPDDSPAALGIDAFMTAPQQQQLRGSASEFAYDSCGLLVVTDVACCPWSSSCGDDSSGGCGLVDEAWFTSGGYTRSPRGIRQQLEAGRPVVLEAGAVFRAGDSDKHHQQQQQQLCVTRWLLQYGAADGQLEKARLEVYSA